MELKKLIIKLVKKVTDPTQIIQIYECVKNIVEDKA